MKQTVVHNFKELKYLLKSGHAPVKDKQPWKGNWQLEYNGQILSHDIPYGVAVKQEQLYKRMGKVYPDKTKFKIRPFKG